MDQVDVHRRILIIDDEPVVRDSCVEILRVEPYEVVAAADGRQGLALLDEFRPDLVFVDLKMPGISGIEVLEAIRDRDPSIVTVVITGYATVDSAVEAMKLGAYDFIPKPFTPDRFRLITSRALERRRLVLETTALRSEREMLRENFAAIVSHELKSPLAAVQQSLFALSFELAETISEDHQQKLERMKTRIRDLVDMVDTWLRGFSADLGAIRERFRLVEVEIPIAKAVESIAPHALRKNVEVITSIGSSPVVYGDEATIAEALTNLIGNAAKYSYEGGIVTVTAEACHDHTRIDISDSGVGIPEEDIARVFGDFYRGSAEAGGEEGAGLGLAITRRIIEAHGGSISVESEPGKGTTFTVLLPAEPSAQQISVAPHSSETPVQEGTE